MWYDHSEKSFEREKYDMQELLIHLLPDAYLLQLIRVQNFFLSLQMSRRGIISSAQSMELVQV